MKRRSASVQLLVVSCICFCCPGLFNALTSFASGLADPTVAYWGNVVVYLSFASCSFLVAARVKNIQVALLLGTAGYVCYAAALFNLQSPVFGAALQVFYVACAVLGVSAGFLWTAQGRMVMSYATPENQGSYLSTFWIIFNLGAASGGILSFILNFSNVKTTAAGEKMSEHCSGAMYAAFVATMSIGVLLALVGIVDSKEVVRGDGSAPSDNFLEDASNETWWAALQLQFSGTATKELRALVFLLPLFAYSNWFYAYHSFFNVAAFDVRTSGLASSFYWLAQMGAAYTIGRALDDQVRKRSSVLQLSTSGFCSERQRELNSVVADIAVRSLLAFALLANVTWAIGWYLQSSLGLQYDTTLGLDFAADMTSVLPPFLLYVVYGWNDALCQVWIYWYMGSLADRDATACGHFAGVYKGVQAISAAMSWQIGAMKTDPETQLFVNWLLCNVAMLGAFISVGSFRGTADGTEALPLLRLQPSKTLSHDSCEKHD
jgi:hypothetical protein